MQRKAAGLRSFQGAVRRLRSNLRTFSATSNNTGENKSFTGNRAAETECIANNEDKLMTSVSRDEVTCDYQTSDGSLGQLNASELQPNVGLTVGGDTDGNQPKEAPQSGDDTSRKEKLPAETTFGREAALCRIHKKASLNGKISVYLTNRDLVITGREVTPLVGVYCVDPKEVNKMLVFAQIVMIFRYGRDDEEIMGLKLSNESVLSMERLYPCAGNPYRATLDPSQEMLLERLGPNAYPMTMKINQHVPPSVRLHPTKEYRGAAIGISYHLLVFAAESDDTKAPRKNLIRMALRIIQFATADLLRAPAPRKCVEKYFLLREGNLALTVSLDRPWFPHGSPLNVTVHVSSKSLKAVRKLKITAVQNVDVSMFSNGRFKNVLATVEDTPSSSLTNCLEKEYQLCLSETYTGHWVALEDRYGRLTSNLASTTLKDAPAERNFFAIYVAYYVKVRLVLAGVGKDVTAKLPFVLIREGHEYFDEHESCTTNRHRQGNSNTKLASSPTPAPNGKIHTDL